MLTTTKEDGQGLVEYALILVLLALAVFLMAQLFGSNLTDTYSEILSSIEAVT